MIIPLAQSASVTLDGRGFGQLVFQPSVYGSSWDIDRVVTAGNSGTQPILSLYKGLVSNNTVLDSTGSGNDDVDETGIHLDASDSLVCVYTGGSPGALMTVTVTGQNNTGRGGNGVS